MHVYLVQHRCEKSLMMIVPVNRLMTKKMMPRKIIVKVLLLRPLSPSLTEHLMVPHKQHYIIPLLLPGKVSCSTMRSGHPPATATTTTTATHTPPSSLSQTAAGPEGAPALFRQGNICELLPVCSQNNPDIFFLFFFF